MIRKLRAEEIELRVGNMKETGCSLLLYKDARADMKILDETYGPTGWQRTHELIGGNLYCTVSIWDDLKGQWISKQDVGVESYSQAEKGQASDSFKRACVNLGIGRELYTSPFIWVFLEKEETYNNNNGNPALKPAVKFRVNHITYTNDGDIDELKIVDQNGRTRFEKRKTQPRNNLGAAAAQTGTKHHQEHTPRPTNTPVQQSKPKTQGNIQPGPNKPDQGRLSCQSCNDTITERVAAYSQKNYGRRLCMDCQKKQG